MEPCREISTGLFLFSQNAKKRGTSHLWLSDILLIEVQDNRNVKIRLRTSMFGR